MRRTASFSITRATEWPESFEHLADAARAEGVRNMAMLQSNWLSGAERFDAPGAALFFALLGEDLIGAGGVTLELNWPQPARRVRRFYVHPEARRLGVGRALASAAMQHALGHVSILTCNARASDAAAPFWESLGFQPVAAEGITHLYRAG